MSLNTIKPQPFKAGDGQKLFKQKAANRSQGCKIQPHENKWFLAFGQHFSIY